MKNFRFLLIPALLFLSMAARAQSIPVNPKFGAVSDAELEMTTYQPDTSAAVVVLWRRLEVEAAFSGSFGLTRKVTLTERVKILKESGKSYPDLKVYYSTATDPRESVSGIKMVTYNKDGGKKTVDKLNKKMIFDEEVSDKRRSVSFSAQNVRVGSVVEYTFTTESPRVTDIGTIFLQTGVPVNLSEAIFTRARYFDFNRIARGFVHCTSETTIENSSTILQGGASIDYDIIVDKHRAVDVPALKSAPHCYCPDLYRLGFEYELRSFNADNLYYKDFSSNWATVDKTIKDSGLLSDFYARSRFEAEAAEAKASAADEAGQVAAIRNAVVAKVRWNGKKSIWPSAAKAFREQEGNSADINALVAAALEGAGFKVEPVFLDTRDNGLLMDYHVSVDAFNAVILKVTAPSGAGWFMEAADDQGYLNVLPVNYLVERARVVTKKDAGYWVDLSKLCRNQLIDSVEMEVAADGAITGKRSQKGFNNWACTIKSTLGTDSNLEKIAEAIENEDGIEVEDLKVEGKDVWSPEASISYGFRSQATAAGSLLYVRPFVTKYHDAADFRASERIIPVEFAYPETVNYSAAITIPEGWTVESLPQPMVIPGKVADSRVAVQCLYDGERKVTLNYRFTLNGRLVQAAQYPELRSYWEQLCNVYETTIVLKKL